MSSLVSADPLNGMQNLKNRIAAAIAAICGEALAAAPKTGKRKLVRNRQILNVDVIAYAGVISGRIIRAEHLNIFSLAAAASLATFIK
jgi:hypothetical protein